MARTLKSDKWLLFATLLLAAVSLVMVYSASAIVAMGKYGSAYHDLNRQAIFVGVGLIGLLIAMRVDYHVYRRPVVIWSILAIVFVLLIAVFGFQPIKGTRRWIVLPGFSLQPSELAKLAVIFFTAALLERRMHRITEWRYALTEIGVVTGITAGLILKQPDFGTSAALSGVVLAMVFAAGLSFRHMAAVAAVLLPAAGAFVYFESYRLDRITAFMHPEDNLTGGGYQLNQSLIAVGSGGPWGRGLMEGMQKLYYLPEPHNDFIYAVIGEELGLVGTTAVLLCFVAIAVRGIRAAMYAPDRLGALLATGLTAMIAGQAFVNISVVLGLVPTKGIPLPFVSNGGSSMVVNLIAMGILLNITQHATAKDPGGRVRSIAHTANLGPDHLEGAQA